MTSSNSIRLEKNCFSCDCPLLISTDDETIDYGHYEHTNCTKNAFLCQNLANEILGNSPINNTSCYNKAQKRQINDLNFLETKTRVICGCGEILNRGNIKQKISNLDVCTIM